MQSFAYKLENKKIRYNIDRALLTLFIQIHLEKNLYCVAQEIKIFFQVAGNY